MTATAFREKVAAARWPRATAVARPSCLRSSPSHSSLPFLGLLWRAPWGDVWSILTSESALTALRLSLWCSFWATLAALVLGVPLAWLLARVPFPGRGSPALCTLDGAAPGGG